MTDTVIDARPATPKAEEWAERIAAQEHSGMSVKQFCKRQCLTEYSFYAAPDRSPAAVYSKRELLEAQGKLRASRVDFILAAPPCAAA